MYPGKGKPFLQVSLTVFSPKCLAGRFSLGVCSTEGVFGGTAPRRAAWALTPATGLRWGTGRGSAVGKLETKSPVPFKKLNFILILVFPKGTDIKVSLKIQQK